jgi:alcohol dehydrogenase YqhD (iron-dependent ADH family)
VQGLGSHKRVHDSRQDGSGHPPTPKPEAKKYLLTYDGEEIVEIGTEKQILDRLRVDADMGELPDHEGDITIYVLDKMIKAKYDRQIKVKLGVAQPVK